MRFFPPQSDKKTTPGNDNEHKVSYEDLKKKRLKLAEIIINLSKEQECNHPNSKKKNCELGRNFWQEWKYNRIPKAPPVLGLALSGGGARSASFSIGVMKALHERGILKNVDIISSVSGGSYALYWYYMQNLNMDFYKKGKVGECSPGEKYINIFNTDLDDSKNHRFQTHLEKNSDILTILTLEDTSRKVVNWLGQISRFGTLLPVLPVNLFTNLVFDWDMNLFPYRRYYQNGLERTYGLSPCPSTLEDNDGFRNESWRFLFSDPYDIDHNFTFTEIKKFLDDRADKQGECKGDCPSDESTSHRLPFFVINATAGHGRISSLYEINDEIDLSPSAIKRATPNKIFEFTPLGFGSEIFGYAPFIEKGKENNVTEEIYFSKAVSISGAAVDSQFFDSTGPTVIVGEAMRVLNLNLGYQLGNYNMSKQMVAGTNLLPYPLYLFKHSAMAKPKTKGEPFLLPSEYSSKIHLSDGGQSENLATLSLIRRGVKNIIIVDGENDNNKCGEFACFQGLNYLERSLKKDYKMTMKINNLNRQIFDIRNAKASVFTGEISTEKNQKGETIKLINFIYIKLAYDKNEIENYPLSIQNWVTPDNSEEIFTRIQKEIENQVRKEVTQRVKKSVEKRLEVEFNKNFEEEFARELKQELKDEVDRIIKKRQKKSKNFPHVSTVDVFFQKEQFRAYRDLGYYLVSTNENMINTALKDITSNPNQTGFSQKN